MVELLLECVCICIYIYVNNKVSIKIVKGLRVAWELHHFIDEPSNLLCPSFRDILFASIRVHIAGIPQMVYLMTDLTLRHGSNE